MKGRFYLIDCMRSVMIVIVFAHAFEGHHIDALFEWMPAPIRFIIHNGQWAVGLFFVISGFVIMHNLADREIDTSISWRFLARRSIRLDPPYWFAIGLMITFAWLSYKFVPGKESPNFTLGQILSHFFYAQTILGYEHIDPAYWTLCYEFQFYISIVLLLLVGRASPIHPNGKITRVLIIGVSIFTALWPLRLAFPVPSWAFLPYAYLFMLGINAYWASRVPAIRPWFVGYALVLAIGGIFTRDDFATFCALSSLFLLFMATNNRLEVGKNWHVLLFLGKVSYSVYLTHNPITAAVFRVGFMITGRNVATELLWLTVDVIVCVTVGFLMWKAIEWPSTELARRVKLTNRQGRSSESRKQRNGTQGDADGS
ncbi:acyltransferase [Bradyrhizobium sp. 200]|uniref:acyltransferase family protein n=1 Tax=Bradyrhizobium sp. 200 TaxID=2782665 RepID=UPI001FFFF083|nr:acyltransferase [Bradyrhizobium sp. 200]UPJ51686.1 acyltransferase [Bradyrhizobium sp. 200]